MPDSLPDPALRPRGWSLVSKLVLLGSALVAGTVGLFAWIWWHAEKGQTEREWRGSLEHEARLAAVRVQAFVAETGHDAIFLTASPSVRDAADGVTGAELRVAETFRALMRGKSSYAQLRLVGVADAGRELVRVNQLNGTITQTPAGQLQQKGDRDYLRESDSLRQGELYFSEMDLNRDFGVITEPYEPTLRSVAPVFRRDGTKFGWIVINADISPLLAGLVEQKNPAVRLYVANGAGSWLVHPVAEARFGADLGSSWSQRTPSGKDREVFAEDYLFHAQAWPLAAGANREFTVRTACLESDVFQALAEARRQALTAAAVAAVAGIAGMALFAWWSMRRLHRVAEALTKFQHGEPAEPLPEVPRDETGLLAAAFNRMSSRITEQVRSLDAARQEANAASQAKENFLGVMAHEVRTPLNAVTGLLRVLERNRPAPHQEPVLRSLRAATTNLTGLLNDALDWSRLRAGKLELRNEDFSLPELLSQLDLAHRPLAAQKGVDWQSAWSSVPPTVRGDAARLRQILTNLLSNAVKFTDRGSIRFAAEWAVGILTCKVEDTGIGIHNEHIGRIFSPFDQASGEIGRRFGGTGLGLSITRQLAEGMGGTLTAASPGQGAGSCFTLSIPLAAAEASRPTKETGAPDLSGLRLLIVEDSPAGLEVITALMEETGATAAIAADGAQAEGILRDGQPLHGALLDLQLPDTDGFALARLAEGLRPGLPMLAVTAQVSEATREACTAAGMAALIPKPVEASVLFGELHKLFNVSAASPRSTPDGPAPDLWPQLFPGEPARRQRVLAALREELQKARGNLTAAVGAHNTAVIRRMRHQLHTALITLNLPDLRNALDQLTEGNWSCHSAADSALAVALRQLQHAASDQEEGAI